MTMENLGSVTVWVHRKIVNLISVWIRVGRPGPCGPAGPISPWADGPTKNFRPIKAFFTYFSVHPL